MNGEAKQLIGVRRIEFERHYGGLLDLTWGGTNYINPDTRKAWEHWKAGWNAAIHYKPVPGGQLIDYTPQIVVKVPNDHTS